VIVVSELLGVRVMIRIVKNLGIRVVSVDSIFMNLIVSLVSTISRLIKVISSRSHRRKRMFDDLGFECYK